MSINIIGSAATVTQVIEAFYGLAPGYTAYTTHKAYLDANGATAYANAVASSFSSQTDAALATTVLANLGLSAFTDLQTALESAFAAYPTARGIVVMNLANILTQKESDTTYGAAATAFNNKVTSAYEYSIVPTNTTPTTVVVSAGSTYTLTNSADIITGGSGNDLFNASYTTTSGMTLQASDSIDGGTGTDTLNVTIGVAGTHGAGTLKNIETVTANFSAGGTLSLLGAAQVTSVESSGSTQAATFSGLGSATVAMKVTNTDQNATFNFTTAAVAGSADTANITLTNATSGTLTLTSGFETVAITSSAGANTLTALSTTAATKLTAAGDQKLTITGALDNTIATVDASANTGGVVATMGTVAAATITGGAGNDSFTVSDVTGIVSVSAGAGNDTITAATNFASTDIIDGGDGTDTFSTTAVLAEGTTTTKLTNVETLSLSTAGTADTTLTLANLSSAITGVTLVAGTAGAYTIAGPATSLAVKVGSSSTGTLGGLLTLTDTGVGTTDAATVSNNRSTASTDVLAGRAITANGYETLSISTGSSANSGTQTLGAITLTPDSGGSGTVKFTGLNSITTGVITAATIDASGLTGAALFSNTGAATSGATKITGSINSDIITGSSGSATSIDGGTGNDSITGGSGNDTLGGGDGNDSIIAAAGNDNISGGAGNDSITLAGNLTQNDTIDGGDGTDTLSITSANVTTIAGYTTAEVATLNANLSNLERVSISDALSADVNLANLDSINYLALANATNSITGTRTVSKMGAAGTVTYAAAATAPTTDTLVVTLTDSGGSTDVLNVSLAAASGTPDFGNLTADSVETLNITSSKTSTGTSTLNTLDLTSTTGLKTLTVTGAVAFASAISATTVTSVDGSANTGGINVDVTATTAGVSITGTATADTMLGGSGADTLTGGSGNDSLVGSSGADSLDGGDGDDTLDGGAGNDTIVGGAGNDALVTSGGTDSYDGGDGTDALTISASFSNISSITTTSIETLNMASIGATVTVAQFGGFSTITNPGALTFADAGTIAAASNVTVYTLANGTNTFTASTTAANNSVAGGTGADTFNFSSAVYSGAAGADTVTGSTGTDTLNITGNTALSFTIDAATLTGVEKITVANTTTDVTIVTNDANIAASASLTVDASSLTTGKLNWDGSNEADGNQNLIGGNANDTITGGAGAETVDGGSGTDLITGAAGADYLAGGAGNDYIDSGTGNNVDSMLGGLGNDTYLISDAGEADVITDAASSGTTDTLLVGNGISAASVLVNGALDLLGASNAGIEQIVTVDATATFDYAQLTGNAINISEDASNATTIVTVNGSASAVTIDLSSITFTANTYVGAAGAAVVGTAFTTGTDYFSVAGAAGAETITGTTFADSIRGAGAADTITGGLGADTIYGNDGNDIISLTESASSADIVWLSGTSAMTSAVNAGGSDVITGFSTNDVLGLGSTWLVTGFTSDSFVSVSNNTVNGLSAHSAKIIAVAGSIAGASGSAAIATLVGGDSGFSVAANQTAVLTVNDGTDTYVWYVNDNLDGAATSVTSTDIVLIGKLSAFATTTVAGNFLAVGNGL